MVFDGSGDATVLLEFERYLSRVMLSSLKANCSNVQMAPIDKDPGMMARRPADKKSEVEKMEYKSRKYTHISNPVRDRLPGHHLCHCPASCVVVGQTMLVNPVSVKQILVACQYPVHVSFGHTGAMVMNAPIAG